MRVLIPLFFVAFAVTAFLSGDGGVCIGTGISFFAILAAVGLSFNHYTVIDFDHGWVQRWTTGFWGVPGDVKTYSFHEFNEVRVTQDEESFELILMRGRKKLRLTWGGEELCEEGKTLAGLMRLPLDDRSERANPAE
ncbi:hypothetical protein [Algisphaera agarilytica]|uniref:PH domain-containing protein n=1 Tax=Algisphaera agarilytica TaxID=1385975 RepID=A0A7X0LKC7_9BACT|nr:hypothetical protein [Algisphaera agarilytica]MBB6428808.1 hypothetical protein [Algisphaera agarilytica]